MSDSGILTFIPLRVTDVSGETRFWLVSPDEDEGDHTGVKLIYDFPHYLGLKTAEYLTNTYSYPNSNKGLRVNVHLMFVGDAPACIVESGRTPLYFELLDAAERAQFWSGFSEAMRYSGEFSSAVTFPAE